MKHLFPPVWWLMFVLIVALILLSLGYSFGNALWVAVILLPGILCARYFAPQLLFENKRLGIYHSVCLLGAVLTMEYLSIVVANFYVVGLNCGQMPPLLMNPFFMILLLAAAITPEMAVENYLIQRYPLDKTISFISDRRKIILPTTDLLCVESNDSEVWICTTSGESFRTKTRISQWEAILDRRFLRVHRSFIVNTECVTEYYPNQLVAGGRTIEVSRKYKDAVKRHFTAKEPKAPITGQL